MAKIAGLLLLIAVAVYGYTRGPRDHSECLLQHLKPGMSNRATDLVSNACIERFARPRPLTALEIMATTPKPGTAMDLLQKKQTTKIFLWTTIIASTASAVIAAFTTFLFCKRKRGEL